MTQQFENITSVCFTGQRPKSVPLKYDADKWCCARDGLTKLTDKLAELGVTDFISGGAQGADQIAFWAVYQTKQTHAGITNHLYRPFPEQASKWLQHGLFSQDEYNLIVKTADNIHTTAPSFSKRALYQRNLDMLNAADLVIVVAPQTISWQNGEPGGTQNMLREVDKTDKPLIGFDPITQEVFAPRDKDAALIAQYNLDGKHP